MTTVAEISDALHRLPTGERWSLLQEFADELWTDWDRQIESDERDGRLDDFIAQARKDIAASRTRPLDEIIRNS